MSGLERTIGKARRRLWLRRTLRGWRWGALGGLALALGLVLVERLTGWLDPVTGGGGVPGWVYLALAGLVIALPPMWALWRSPGRHEAAAAVDAHLGLKDRLASALYVERSDQPFASQVVRDANEAAGRADLRQALPIQADRGWGAVAALGALVALLAAMLPHTALFGGAQRASNNSADKQQARATQKEIQQVRSSVQRIQQNESANEPSRPGELMKRLASLSRRDLASPQAREQASAEMSEIKQRLDNIARNKEKQIQSMQSAMSRLNSEQSGPADRFENALRRGDYQAAQNALKSMANKLENGDYSAQQKQRMKQQMQNLSKQLSQMAKQAKQQNQAAQQQMQKQLKQAGLNQQQINQLQKQGMNQQAVQQALQKQGMSKQQAQQKARRVQKQARQANGSQRTGGQRQGLSNSLGQMASSLQQGQSGRQQGKQGKQGQSGQKQGQQGGQGQQSSQFKQGAFSGQQQLQQMARMKQSMQQVQRARSQARQAMQQASSGSGGQKQGQKQGRGSRMARGGARGGQKAGAGEGGAPLGRQQQPLNTKRHASEDIKRGRGRVIASWQQDGQMARGESNAEFDRTVQSAQNRAEQAVNEDRVPRRYHGAIRDYFNQLPRSAKQPQGAPASPR